VSIYTRGGDRGETSLLGGARVRKDHPRVEAMGVVDELNAALGWCVTQVNADRTSDRISALQHDLFAIGAQLASLSREAKGWEGIAQAVLQDRIREMERWIDEAQEGLPVLRAFVLPGGAPSAAALHQARTICRRAERALVRLSETEPVHGGLIPYLNRLSDLLFVWARLENQLGGMGDVEWTKP